MKKSLVMVSLLCMMLLVGCSLQLKDQTEKNTIQVNKDGSVTGTLVEPFTESYYKIEELERMVNEEATKYNQSAGDGAVTVTSVEMRDDGTVKVVLNYKSATDYEKFNQKTLFVGTVAEAKASGYAMEPMMAMDGSETISDTQILEKGDSKIVITEEAYDVKVSGKISYISANAEALDKKTAVVKTDAMTYIIYE